MLRLIKPLPVPVKPLPMAVLADEASLKASGVHIDKLKSEYEDRVIRHPLGMGTILHASFVRQTVEKAAALTK